ncbi:chorismate synthase [Pelorhabdus rhamnosifermentans]|uniref:chorismate synthase n=1 Tax=Pelorhabdus rhamnosifermentans TaxID=2772457 RepID=UPI0028AD246F|nr:chorismate synthase [Pelorhabdus rhamnosifermentans]
MIGKKNKTETALQNTILAAKADNDSVGGVIETAAIHLSAGWGDPFFDSLESTLSHLLFSIPAVKSIEFGAGFEFAAMYGSTANDAMHCQDGRIQTTTNHNGGITGGITNGMPLIFRVAIKPTPSISQKQHTVNAQGENILLSTIGRHDPCIVPRAVPVCCRICNGTRALGDDIMKMNLYANNVVLIGMPGCGKSSIGSLLAQALKMKFYDVDRYIEKKEQQSVAELFSHGEDHFRQIESQAIFDIYNKSSIVIATGGGVVTRHQNMVLLQQQGIIFYIERSIEMIIDSLGTAEHRPLLAGNVQRIYTLYEQRKHLYEKYGHYRILNNESCQAAVEKIQAKLLEHILVLKCPDHPEQPLSVLYPKFPYIKNM